ncbi:hypothetical protein F5Y09DRAFT_357077 [Xylaria sp. FL1042]|nr:hypothetical protein F5Y09DRAFT_357077 [Xylaria sp. FL1042]
MSRPIQQIRNLFAKSLHSPQQQDSIAESSRTNTQRPASRPPLEVLYPSPNLSVSNAVEVHIVAVHGLGSNVDWSWTWQDKKGRRPPVHWLKDVNMLPSVVPHARIITYNYESRWHADAPKTRLELCGEDLVKSLHEFRTNAPERPIVFVAHSLGGLVVLYGLLYADRTEKLKHLPASTVGFAPLDTPFRGTKMQNLAKKVAWLMSPMGSHDGIITKDGKHLADQVHTFSELRNKLDIPTTCFFELYDSYYGKKIGLAGLARGKVVEEESAHIPGWGRVQLYADHFQLNKFAGADDRSFVLVSNELSTMCANWKSVIERRKQVTRDRHFMVPFGRNHRFVGRHAILEQLLERVPPNANKDDCQRIAIEGLGGIGKTQITLETVYQIHDRYLDCSVFWVPAIDLTSFENAYREIGQLLQRPGINNEKAHAKMLVKAGLSDAKAVEYLPFSREGSILFTSWNHEVTTRLDISQENNIAVPEMDNSEATNLLQLGLKESQIGDEESTKHLLRFLANLPLAIKQASAYMALNENVTISQYLEFCESSNADLIHLLSRQFEDHHRYKSHARNQTPIATTWLISFEHISQRNPQAADYLKFMCFLAEEDIPVSLLPVTSKINQAGAIGLLYLYAFIIKRDAPGSFDIHRLVRLTMRNWLQEKKELEQWATSLVQRLAEEIPWPRYKNRETWARYLPHTHIVLETGISDVDGTFRSEYGLSFLRKIAETYHLLGKYSEGARLLRQLLKLSEGLLGGEHPDTLSYMNNLAVALQKEGKSTETETINREQLERCERVLGKENPLTLTSMYNLAILYERQGKYKEAENMQQQGLELSEKVLGNEHPQTLGSINNYAVTLPRRGKYEEAEKIYRRVIELRKKVLGKEHPYTLISMHNYALSLIHQKRYQESEEILRETLELSNKVLGRQHRKTLTSIEQLAYVLQIQGKNEEAEEVRALEPT